MKRSLPWVARAIVVVVLTIGAWWWQGMNFDGRTYCEVHHKEFCDGPGFERLAPFVLWSVTFVVTLAIVVAATVTGPLQRGRRAVWAGMIAVPIFVAHSNNLIWAAVVTVASAWTINWLDDSGRRPALAATQPRRCAPRRVVPIPNSGSPPPGSWSSRLCRASDVESS